MICDFKYELLTGAGFEVDRVGVASVTSVGNNVEVLWSASTRQRYKKTEQQLRTITDSFRCYSDGLDMSKIDYGEFNQIVRPDGFYRMVHFDKTVILFQAVSLINKRESI